MLEARAFGQAVGGTPLVARRRGGAGPALFVFGGIHGDEPDSAELCRRFLVAGAADDSAVWVLPEANPDGLAADTKNNARDVDLNRNFAAANWRREHRPGYDPGARPLSEPESAALVLACEALAPALVVAVHQPLRCVNWDGPAAAVAADLADACHYPPQASIGFPTPGSFGSWWGVDLGRPVITLELPPRGAMTDADWAGSLAALERATLWTRRLATSS